MDEQRSQQEAEKLSARSATALRALEDRARSALEAGRKQATSLEAEITNQLEEIAATLATDRAAESQTTVHEAELRTEIDRLAKELDDSRAAWLLEQSALESARDELAKQVASLQAEERATRDEFAKRLANAESQNAVHDIDLRKEIERLTKELDDSRAAWLLEQTALETAQDELTKQVSKLQVDERAARDELAKQLADAESQSEVHDVELRAEIERLTSELEQSRAASLVEQSALETARDELAKQVAQLQADLETASDDSALRAEIERLTKDVEQSRADWLAEQSALESARDELANQVAKLQSELLTASDDSALRTEVERLTKELAETRADWLIEQSALETGRDELAMQVAKLQVEERAAREDWAKQLADFELKLREQQTAWNNQRTEWSVTRATLELERNSLQQKFELALQDVQRFRGRVAELEQELSRRPEQAQADSAELVALRAERDALAERVEQLERQPAAQIDANAEQQMADLQRRFELAVEDVRELKTKNAVLESQIAAGGNRASRPADSGGLDWESQKRRLLESLEDEGEVADEPARQNERVRIESTIEMTDAVVAEKDREIAELKSQLAHGSTASAAADEAHDQKIRELVDSDDVIAEHRKRVSELEREMEGKLRAAELELSLERAKIARERVELDELRDNLDSQRADMGPSGGATPGAPRRRWLSKLGLSGEEQE